MAPCLTSRHDGTKLWWDQGLQGQWHAMAKSHGTTGVDRDFTALLALHHVRSTFDIAALRQPAVGADDGDLGNSHPAQVQKREAWWTWWTMGFWWILWVLTFRTNLEILWDSQIFHDLPTIFPSNGTFKWCHGISLFVISRYSSMGPQSRSAYLQTGRQCMKWYPNVGCIWSGHWFKISFQTGFAVIHKMCPVLSCGKLPKPRSRCSVRSIWETRLTHRGPEMLCHQGWRNGDDYIE